MTAPRLLPLRRLGASALSAALCALGALCLLGGCSRLLSIVDPSAF